MRAGRDFAHETFRQAQRDERLDQQGGRKEQREKTHRFRAEESGDEDGDEETGALVEYAEQDLGRGVSQDAAGRSEVKGVHGSGGLRRSGSIA